uniref:Putative secreted protein n=1 Tax=Anopheles darlingi TaxID=43151 RepID=A0A2M4DE52_ANODA
MALSDGSVAVTLAAAVGSCCAPSSGSSTGLPADEILDMVTTFDEVLASLNPESEAGGVSCSIESDSFFVANAALVPTFVGADDVATVLVDPSASSAVLGSPWLMVFDGPPTAT